MHRRLAPRRGRTADRCFAIARRARAAAHTLAASGDLARSLRRLALTRSIGVAAPTARGVTALTVAAPGRLGHRVVCGSIRERTPRRRKGGHITRITHRTRDGELAGAIQIGPLKTVGVAPMLAPPFPQFPQDDWRIPTRLLDHSSPPAANRSEHEKCRSHLDRLRLTGRGLPHPDRQEDASASRHAVSQSMRLAALLSSRHSPGCDCTYTRVNCPALLSALPLDRQSCG
jgi:hypothetical protein